MNSNIFTTVSENQSLKVFVLYQHEAFSTQNTCLYFVSTGSEKLVSG